MEQKKYPTIDLLKFVFALSIVAIHTNLLSVDTNYCEWMISSVLFRSAVPFFFVVSGYFYAGKLFSVEGKEPQKCMQILFGYCKKLFPPLILWGGVGLLIELIKMVINGKSIFYMMIYAIRTVFYPLNAMWYLAASIVGISLLTYMYKKSNNWKMVWFISSCIGYGIVLLCNNYFFLIENTAVASIVRMYMKFFVSARNGIFLAPMYLGIGFLIRDESMQMYLKRHKITPFVGLIGGAVLLCIEATLLFGCTRYDDSAFFLSQLIMIPCLVCVAIQYDVPVSSTCASYMRRFSTGIYYVHRTIRVLMLVLLAILPIEPQGNVLLFLSTTFISVLICFISYRTPNKILRCILG